MHDLKTLSKNLNVISFVLTGDSYQSIIAILECTCTVYNLRPLFFTMQCANVMAVSIFKFAAAH